MCWFFNKKRKEEMEIMQQKIDNLESQISSILDILKDLNETDGRLAAEIFQIKDTVIYHIENDMDMVEDDGTEWSEN